MRVASGDLLGGSVAAMTKCISFVCWTSARRRTQENSVPSSKKILREQLYVGSEHRISYPGKLPFVVRRKRKSSSLDKNIRGIYLRYTNNTPAEEEKMSPKGAKKPQKATWSRLPKNHVPLEVTKVIRFAKKDMEILRKVAKNKGLRVSALIRLAIFEYLKKEVGYERA